MSDNNGGNKIFIPEGGLSDGFKFDLDNKNGFDFTSATDYNNLFSSLDQATTNSPFKFGASSSSSSSTFSSSSGGKKKTSGKKIKPLSASKSIFQTEYKAGNDNKFDDDVAAINFQSLTFGGDITNISTDDKLRKQAQSSASLISALSYFKGRKDYSDVILVDNKQNKLYAHSIILAARSLILDKWINEKRYPNQGNSNNPNQNFASVLTASAPGGLIVTESISIDNNKTANNNNNNTSSNSINNPVSPSKYDLNESAAQDFEKKFTAAANNETSQVLSSSAGTVDEIKNDSIVSKNDNCNSLNYYSPIELHFPEEDRETLQLLMDSCYDTPGLLIPPKSVAPCIRLAKTLQCESLRIACEKALKTQINFTNACELFGDDRLDVQSQTSILEYIKSHAKQIISESKSSGFDSLSPEKISAIVQSDALNISEVELFRGIYNWATQYWIKQETSNVNTNSKNIADTVKQLDLSKKNTGVREILKDVLPHIRFGCMSNIDIVNSVAPAGILTQEELIEIFTYQGNNKAKIRFGTKARARIDTIKGNDGFDYEDDGKSDGRLVDTRTAKKRSAK